MLLFIGTISDFPNVTIGSFVIGIFGAPIGIILLLYQIFLFVTPPVNDKKVNHTTNNVSPDTQSIKNTNSLKETSPIIEEKTTKYKGNQLKNGSSP